MSNTLRHSNGSELRVRLDSRGSILRFQVQDNGIGPAAEMTGRGHGLSNTNTRLLALGGEFAFKDAAPGLMAFGQLEIAGDAK